MLSKMKLGSADWNLWPLGMAYETTFPIFKKLGISFVELGIYTPSKELTKQRLEEISKLEAAHNVQVSAALFSLTPDRWAQGAFSNTKSGFLEECEIFLAALQSAGIKYANIWTGADLPDANLEETLLTLKKLDALASKYDGVVSIEYKADTIFPNGADLADMLKPFNFLQVLIDTGHAFALEENVIDLIKDLHSRKLMGAMHLGDAIAGDSDADLPCGRVHDFSPILKVLEEINFSASANFDLYGAAVDEEGPGPESILVESSGYLKSLLGTN
jgi:sugar phosphate isomerase/epimerase